ncbi:unnamed protein product [Vitrella brassicaformis CCMP3155]|uniref:Uncharacterized protein n=1 Tax=Vitrella brassicaformis (strain CCMP3155) TaxID=1169540 RepID=A0A0G4FZB2_VITBC|nr:unnamed protein product [Vitrella brassicaformis CCMP3155]|eukprot:CEM20863.1 unnamed protein product [Vitrella brassicaformis CCMP3155]
MASWNGPAVETAKEDERDGRSLVAFSPSIAATLTVATLSYRLVSSAVSQLFIEFVENIHRTELGSRLGMQKNIRYHLQDKINKRLNIKPPAEQVKRPGLVRFETTLYRDVPGLSEHLYTCPKTNMRKDIWEKAALNAMRIKGREMFWTWQAGRSMANTDVGRRHAAMLQRMKERNLETPQQSRRLLFAVIEATPLTGWIDPEKIAADAKKHRPPATRKQRRGKARRAWEAEDIYSGEKSKPDIDMDTKAWEAEDVPELRKLLFEMDLFVHVCPVEATEFDPAPTMHLFMAFRHLNHIWEIKWECETDTGDPKDDYICPLAVLGAFMDSLDAIGLRDMEAAARSEGEAKDMDMRLYRWLRARVRKSSGPANMPDDPSDALWDVVWERFMRDTQKYDDMDGLLLE